jgi:ribose transport system permease protein
MTETAQIDSPPPSGPPGPPGEAGGRGRISFQRVQTASVLLLTLGLCVVCGVLRPDSFLTGYNLVENLLVNAAFMGVIACGMTFVMIAGGFDLSVASMTVTASIVAVLVLQAFGGDPAVEGSQVPLTGGQVALAIGVAVACAMAVGAALGAVNGTLIAYVGVNPFVVTLSTMLIFRGLAFVLSDRGQSKRIPFAIQQAFRRVYWGEVLTFGSGRAEFSLLVPVLIFVVLFAACVYLLRFTRFGHYTYAVGGNENAAWLAGVNTKLVKAATYAIVGVTSGIAALIYAAQSSTAQADANQGLEFQVITCVIVGGTPLGGGAGSLLRTLNGLLLLAVIENMLTKFAVPEEYRKIVRGLIILTVVTVDMLVRRRSRT